MKKGYNYYELARAIAIHKILLYPARKKRSSNSRIERKRNRKRNEIKSIRDIFESVSSFFCVVPRRYRNKGQKLPNCLILSAIRPKTIFFFFF